MADEPLTVEVMRERLKKYNPKAIVGQAEEVTDENPDGFMPFTWIGGQADDDKIILE